jgi:RIO kinase 2
MGEPDPDFKAVVAESIPSQAIDVQLRASGFTKNQEKELEDYTAQVFEDGRSASSERELDLSSDEDDEEEEEEEAVEEELEEDEEPQYDLKLNDDEIADLAAQVQAAMNEEDGINKRGTYDEEVGPMKEFNHRAFEEPSVTDSDESSEQRRARRQAPSVAPSKAELRKERKAAQKKLAMETASMMSVDPAAAADAIRQRLKLEKQRKNSKHSNFGAPKVNHSKEKHGRGHKEKVSKVVDSFWG